MRDVLLFNSVAAAVAVGTGVITWTGFWLYSRHISGQAKMAREQWSRTRGDVVKTALWSYRGQPMPAMTYSYMVQGQTYFGRRIQFGGWVDGKAEAADYLRAHPEGSQIDVLYDPERPNRAVLRTEVGAKNYVLAGWICAAAFCVVAGFTFFTRADRSFGPPWEASAPGAAEAPSPEVAAHEGGALSSDPGRNP